MLATGNRLLSGNRLLESKTLGKRFFFEKFFWTKWSYSIFSFEKIFLYLSWCFSWNSYISWVFSWILILDWTTLWFLKLVWLLILDLSLWHHQNKLGKLCFHIEPQVNPTKFNFFLFHFVFFSFLCVWFWVKMIFWFIVERFLWLQLCFLLS